MFNLLRHELISRRGAILGWGVGLALFGIMYIAIYPQMAEHLVMLNTIPLYQSMGLNMGSLEGFLASAVVQFIPVILVIYVVISSSSTLAGEEEKGTLELMVTMPLARWQIMTMKALALSMATFLILCIAALGSVAVFAYIKTMIETDLSSSQLFIAILSSWPLLLAFSMMGLFFGAYLPTQRAASMVLTIVILVSYFGKILALSLPSLEALKPVFLFSHFDTSPEIFTRGIQANDVLILFGIAIVFYALAIISFDRRDIGVGLWPWQRAKKQ